MRIEVFRSSVRPGLAWMFGLGITILAVIETWKNNAVPTWYIGIAGGAISSYFVSRQGERK